MAQGQILVANSDNYDDYVTLTHLNMAGSPVVLGWNRKRLNSTDRQVPATVEIDGSGFAMCNGTPSGPTIAASTIRNPKIRLRVAKSLFRQDRLSSETRLSVVCKLGAASGRFAIRCFPRGVEGDRFRIERFKLGPDPRRRPLPIGMAHSRRSRERTTSGE
jgi:hypothetical protein